jgi:hypothetical protein
MEQERDETLVVYTVRIPKWQRDDAMAKKSRIGIPLSFVVQKCVEDWVVEPDDVSLRRMAE